MGNENGKSSDERECRGGGYSPRRSSGWGGRDPIEGPGEFGFHHGFRTDPGPFDVPRDLGFRESRPDPGPRDLLGRPSDGFCHPDRSSPPHHRFLVRRSPDISPPRYFNRSPPHRPSPSRSPHRSFSPSSPLDFHPAFIPVHIPPMGDVHPRDPFFQSGEDHLGTLPLRLSLNKSAAASTEPKSPPRSTSKGASPPDISELEKQRKAIAEEAEKRALPKSDKRCGQYVRQAAEAALGVKINVANSAKDYGPKLEAVGFECVDPKEPPQVGDIRIYPAVKGKTKDDPGHPHGHIQIFVGNGRWTSDFKQKTEYASVDYKGVVFKTYRYFGK